MPQNLFKIYDGRNGFWQWDTGQKLIVLDDNIDEVHFSTKDMMHALVSKVDLDNDGLRVCYIPDIILTLPKNLIAYAYILDENMTRTVRSVKFPVTPRPIPSNYVSNQNDKIENILKKIEQLENAVDAAEFKKFNTMEEAKLWAKDNDCVGLLISVNIDGNWVACIIEDNDNIFPIKMSIDTSLTQAGSAADAKAVGDALNEKQPKGNYLTSDDGNELDNRIKVLEDNKADWNQYDHNAPGYIENRPFYDSNNEVLVDTQVAMELYMGNSASRPHGANLIFEVGAKYRVYFDKSVAEVIANDPYRILFSVDSMNIEVSSAYVIIEYPSTQSLTQFKVEKVEELKQLDEKFIPDTIARKTDILEQVNADWNQSDPNAKDYIKNKPFYESAEVGEIVAEYHDLVFTKNNDKYISNSFYLDAISIFKSFADGAKFKVVLGDREFVSMKQDYYIGNGSIYYSVEPDTGEPFCIIVKTTGITIYATEPVNGDQMIIYTCFEQVKQLDEKFIPGSIARKADIPNIPEQVQSDWSQNNPNAKDYVKNRPFYEEYKILGTFMRGETYSQISLTVGKSYIVDCDGAIYTVVCEQLSNGKGLRVFKEGVDGALFLIYETSQYVRVDRVVVMEPELIVHKLDEKFIPDSIARVNDISEAVSADEEIVDILIQEDMLFAFTDSTGSILTDENNNILTW